MNSSQNSQAGNMLSADELASHHSSAEIATFRTVLATLINVLPEGDDLWAKRSASWDAHLQTLRTLLESPEEKGT